MTDAARRSRIDALLDERLSSRHESIVHIDEPTAPLSHVQQSLWLSAQLADAEPVNNRPIRLRIRGELDPSALGRSLEMIVERHAVLRSTFPLDGAEPVQVIGASRFQLGFADVSTEPDPMGAARRLARRHTSRRFDLLNEPAFDPLLIRVDDGDHLLAVAMHHIVVDGWSERLFISELTSHYDAVVERRQPADLPHLDVTYADYARWERSGGIDASFDDQLDHWTSRLADLPPDLELPKDRGVAPDLAADPVDVRIPASLFDRVAQVGRDRGATVFMTLLAALQALVSRHAGADDLVIGVATPGRSHRATETLIGCFVNTVAIRSDVSDDPSFVALLDRARRETIEALDNSTVPFSRVFGALRPWTPDRLPLFRVHFQMRDFPQPIRPSNHIDVSVYDPALAAASHLSVRAATDDDGAVITFGYDPTRFERSTIERWAGHYVNLLEAVAEDPTVPIGSIPLVGDDERRLVIDGFNRADTDVRVETRLPAEALAEVAGRIPDAVAIEAGDRRVSYAELDGMVDRVAAWLVDHAIEPEDMVVIYSDRSVETVVAIFGALRAGVGYIPIDSNLTSEWLSTVVGQARPKAVLTRPGLLSGVDVGGVAHIDDLVAGPPVAPVRGRAAPEHLAYVLYTSGSTGPPKGVLVEQRHLAAFLAALERNSHLGEGDRTVWFHSISFDAVTTNLHFPLVSGATMIVLKPDVTSSIPGFLEWLADESVTHLRMPAGFFAVMVEEMDAAGLRPPPSLRLVAFGGEQSRTDVIAAWQRITGGTVRTLNTYGPTETTVWVTAKDLTEPDEHPSDWVSIGRPMPPSKLYVLDTDGRPCPIGIPGEVYISGPLVARGYLGAPDITADRFVPDPFSDEPHARMYRSGDLGRWLPSGELEVLGRLDRQVKVRGFRVEPAEIEAALRSAEGVTDAAVVPRPGPDGTMALHAYITVDASSAIDTAKLRDGLELPSFMRPATLTVVAEMPKTISGKLDSNSLPQPGVAQPEPPPRVADAGQVIAEIWCDVLGIEQVGPSEDFFELGGHSLLAIKVMSRILDRLDMKVPLVTLFEHPTLAGFTAAVAGAVPEQREEIGDVASPGDAVTDDSSPSRGSELDRLLEEIEAMSDEEAAALLAELEGNDG